MPNRKRLIKNDSSYISLRVDQNNKYQSWLNVIATGLFLSHLLEREYAVYAKIAPSGELTIRIYSGEDKYELVIYPTEDARPILVDACKTLGGAADFERMIGLAHRLEALQKSSGSADRNEAVS